MRKLPPIRRTCSCDGCKLRCVEGYNKCWKHYMKVLTCS